MIDDNSKSKTDFSVSGSPSVKQWPIVLVIFFLAFCIAYLLYWLKPEAEKKVVKDEPPLAEYVVADRQAISVPVLTQGNIKAKTYIKLVAEVSGRVTHVAKLKMDGGFFQKGELLLSIDDTDYRLAMTRAKAQVAAAKQQLIRAETEAGQAKYDLQQIGRNLSKSSAYALREPQLAEARANLQAAQADLEIARLQMQRTNVIAPFDGRVVSKQVDTGQYVSTGTLLADIYSTESVTVRLPLSLRQTELLGLKLHNNQELINAIKIQLIAEYSSKRHLWPAILSHTEGELDARNRLVYLVAEVNEPYLKNSNFIDRPPLTPGMFVKAQLTGLEEKLIKLPRSALRYGGIIWVLDENNKLLIKPIETFSKDKSHIYIKSGLDQGDKVIINSVDYPLNGMSLLPQSVGDLGQKNIKDNHE